MAWETQVMEVIWVRPIPSLSCFTELNCVKNLRWVCRA